MDGRSNRARTASRSAGSFRFGAVRAGNADTNSRSLTNAVVAVNISDIIGSGIFVDSRIIEHRRVIDSISIYGHGKRAHVRRRRIDRPGDCDQFSTASRAWSAFGGRKDRISHATCVAVDHNIFNDPYFFALRRFHPCTYEFANLNGRALGLC